MTLDEIMEKEKFNGIEKALVKHPMLSQPDRVKIISDIKTAKSNDRQSQNILLLTWSMLLMAGIDIAADAIRNSSFPFPYNSIAYGSVIISICLISAFGLSRK